MESESFATFGSKASLKGKTKGIDAKLFEAGIGFSIYTKGN